MADNSRKTAQVLSLKSFATQKGQDENLLQGKALPCRITKVDKQMVTVAFEINSRFTLPEVKIPIHTSKYDWIPYQVGDKGVAVPIDTYLGGISGLGGGTADLSQRANLSTHRFVPIAHTAWTTPDGTMRVVQGPGGVLLQDLAGNTKLTIDSHGHIMINGELRVTGQVYAGYGTGDQVGLRTHDHSGVTAGGDNTGPRFRGPDVAIVSLERQCDV